MVILAVRSIPLISRFKNTRFSSYNLDNIPAILNQVPVLGLEGSNLWIRIRREMSIELQYGYLLLEENNAVYDGPVALDLRDVATLHVEHYHPLVAVPTYKY